MTFQSKEHVTRLMLRVPDEATQEYLCMAAYEAWGVANRSRPSLLARVVVSLEELELQRIEEELQQLTHPGRWYVELLYGVQRISPIDTHVSELMITLEAEPGTKYFYAPTFEDQVNRQEHQPVVDQWFIHARDVCRYSPGSKNPMIRRPTINLICPLLGKIDNKDPK